MRDFVFLDSKITAHGDCSHVIKRCLLLGRKIITNLDSRLKSRDTTLPIKVHTVKAMVFPVVTCRCEMCSLLETVGPGQFPCLFQLLEAAWIPYLVVHSSFFKASHHRSLSLPASHWPLFCLPLQLLRTLMIIVAHPYYSSLPSHSHSFS